MNLKTTFLLVLLVAAGAAGCSSTPPDADLADSKTLTFLEKSLQPANLTRITLAKGNDTRYTLERNGPEWSLPGRWPVRTQDVDHLVQILTGLRSRFAPVPVAKDADLSEYGLGDGAITVKIKLGDRNTPCFWASSLTKKTASPAPPSCGSMTSSKWCASDRNRRRIGSPPGILAATPSVSAGARRQGRGQQREGRTSAGQEIRVQGPDASSRSSSKAATGRSASRPPTAPIRQAQDAPGRLADFWADRFVEQKDKKLADFGLDNPSTHSP